MSVPNEIAWYKLDDDAATTTVVDAKGNHHGATASEYTSAMSIDPGKIGKAFYFDGNSDRNTTVSDHADFDFTAGFSIAVWLKPDSTDALRLCIQRYDATSGDGFTIAQCQVNGGRWWCYLFIAGEQKSIFSDAAPSGGWQHVVFVREVDGTIKMYVDGVLQADTESAAGEIDSNGALRLGCAFNDTYRYQGEMDDARLFGDALSAEQVAALYNEGNGTNKPLADLLGVFPKYLFHSPIFMSPVVR